MYRYMDISNIYSEFIASVEMFCTINLDFSTDLVFIRNIISKELFVTHESWHSILCQHNKNSGTFRGPGKHFCKVIISISINSRNWQRPSDLVLYLYFLLV